MTLENLIGKGLFGEPTNPVEIARFQQKITKKLADAQCPDISLDTRYDTAYEALLQLGSADFLYNARLLQRGIVVCPEWR